MRVAVSLHPGERVELVVLARDVVPDEEAYRSEVLGGRGAGPPRATALGRRVLSGLRGSERRPRRRLRAGHRAPGGDRVVVDVVRSWRALFNPAGVVAEAAALLKTYRLATVTGDRYAGEWPREAFRSHEVFYELAAQDRSALYLDLLPLVNSGRVELLDLVDLLRELRGLERRRGTSGKDRVDHRPGAHDDRANAVAGLVSLLKVSPAFGSIGSQRSGSSLYSRVDYTRSGLEGRGGRERLFGW